MSDRVALIGVGAMGCALLVRLRAAGKEVQAYDVAPVGLQDARSGGTIAFALAAAAAHTAVYVHVLLAHPLLPFPSRLLD